MFLKAKLTPFALLSVTAMLFLPRVAAAQPSEDGFDKDPKDTMDGKTNDKAEASSGDKMPGEKDKSPKPAGEDALWNTKEDVLKPTRYVGLRFRDAILPKAILNIFADGGATVNIPMVGLEFGTRRDRLEYVLSLSYADYSSGDMLFKAKNDLDFAYERVQSDMAVISAQIELLYEFPLDDKDRYTLLVGGGVGIGGVIGDLHRRQVYPGQTGADPADPTQWNDCKGAGDPFGGLYCDGGNDHFGNYTEPSWASGGSKPFIFPWLALPQVSFRYKPIKYVQARADVGFALTSGVYFGLGLGYVL